MNKIFLIIFLISFLNANSQESKNKIYDDAKIIIKKSLEFKKYQKENKALNSNFNVSEKMFTICEFSDFFKEKKNLEIYNYCEGKIWINEAVTENCDLSKKSDKGKKSFNLRFTNTLDNYFVAELKFRSKTNQTLIYYFQIKEDNLFLIKTNMAFYD